MTNLENKSSELLTNNYQLILKIPFVEIDDVSARQNAKLLLEQLNLPFAYDVKLQKLIDNSAPKGIQI